METIEFNVLKGYHNCVNCGGKTKQTGHNTFKCEGECKQTTYISVATTVGAFLFSFDENGEPVVLITQRAKDPGKGKFDDPGGFLDPNDDSLEEALLRELKEELNLQLEPESLMYLGSSCMIYKFGGKDIPSVTATFTGYVTPKQKAAIIANEELESFKWIKENDFDESQMLHPEAQGPQVRKAFKIAHEYKAIHL